MKTLGPVFRQYVIPAKAGICQTYVIPAKAGIHLSLAEKERARLKIVKALAIIYLLWVVFYSLTAGRAWVGDALAFKLNGGPQLVSQLESDGFKVTGTQVEADRNFSALSL